ncbi:GNAT family N-acetyltransferase [Raineyella sp. W15-4]|uniref:GNAT family N-acetyltransferase n=1 Tax=Raineyella sp. W15-4 TaxID=3081651 RepID=UPI002955A141|nr:GNAT family N-acetyltransferase [Raineyella sp. W15-4]WOQ16565.1 N-acetyltransferase family protein [Raineyella sp. W15-4]
MAPSASTATTDSPIAAVPTTAVPGQMIIRDAIPADAAACAAIYAPYVDDTTITFEEVAPSVEEMAGRMARAATDWAWLVAEVDGRVLGYAYAGRFKERVAFRWSCETSVYLAADTRGRGLGKLLYTTLLDRLTQRGYRTAVAVITQPNEASMALHRSFGFEQVALLPSIGFKHNAWRDVVWLLRSLGDGPVPDQAPAEPR